MNKVYKGNIIGVNEDLDKENYKKLKTLKDNITMLIELEKKSQELYNVFLNLDIGIDSFINDDGIYKDILFNINHYIAGYDNNNNNQLTIGNKKNIKPDRENPSLNTIRYEDKYIENQNQKITCNSNSKDTIKNFFRKYSNLSYLYILKHKELETAFKLIVYLSQYKKNILNQFIKLIDLLKIYENDKGKLAITNEEIKLPKDFITSLGKIVEKQHNAFTKTQEFINQVNDNKESFIKINDPNYTILSPPQPSPQPSPPPPSQTNEPPPSQPNQPSPQPSPPPSQPNQRNQPTERRPSVKNGLPATRVLVPAKGPIKSAPILPNYTEKRAQETIETHLGIVNKAATDTNITTATTNIRNTWEVLTPNQKIRVKKALQTKIEDFKKKFENNENYKGLITVLDEIINYPEPPESQESQAGGLGKKTKKRGSKRYNRMRYHNIRYKRSKKY